MGVDNKDLTSKFSKNPYFKQNRISKGGLHELYRLEKHNCEDRSGLIVLFRLQPRLLVWLFYNNWILM